MGLIQYLRDTKGEMKHVSWPTRRQSLVYTALVVVVSIAISLYLGFFDLIFAKLLEFFVA